MAASALHLVERVLPDVPLRQYVLSPPFELRGLLAANSTVVSKMVRVFVQAVFRRLERWAARQSLHGAQSGSVTALQRFTKTLDVGVHLHGLFLDGVYVEDAAEGPLRFVDAPPPTQGELEQIAGDVFERTRKFLDDAGYLDTDVAHVR